MRISISLHCTSASATKAQAIWVERRRFVPDEPRKWFVWLWQGDLPAQESNAVNPD